MYPSVLLADINRKMECNETRKKEEFAIGLRESYMRVVYYRPTIRQKNLTWTLKLIVVSLI